MKCSGIFYGVLMTHILLYAMWTENFRDPCRFG